jgi:phospholipid/cholesterol/gamma-HCH transport system substrate-binding protein
MDDRIIQFRVGVLVVATCIITAILVVLFGELPRIASRQYTLYVAFKEAPGVTVDTPVRKSGILIGRVSDVDLRDAGGVLVTLRIDGQRTLREDETCRITTGNVLLGDAAIEFVPGGNRDGSHEPIGDGQVIRGEVATSPLDVMDVLVDVAQVVQNLEDDVALAAGTLRTAGDEVAGVSRNLNTAVTNNQAQMRRIMQKSEQAIDRFDLAMVAVNELVGDDPQRARLRDVVDEMPELLAEARETLKSFQSMAARAESVAVRAEANLANLEGFTGPLGERGAELVENISTSIGQLDDVLAEMAEFGKALNNSEGSLGQFVHNPDLYQRFNRAAENIEQISVRLRPVVEDARIFTDKIARHPGVLTSGVLSPRQSGVKFPTFAAP